MSSSISPAAPYTHPTDTPSPVITTRERIVGHTGSETLRGIWLIWEVYLISDLRRKGGKVVVGQMGTE